jgi:hypothetical protein
MAVISETVEMAPVGNRIMGKDGKNLGKSSRIGN